jgi:hypothetical protein
MVGWSSGLFTMLGWSSGFFYNAWMI